MIRHGQAKSIGETREKANFGEDLKVVPSAELLHFFKNEILEVFFFFDN